MKSSQVLEIKTSLINAGINNKIIDKVLLSLLKKIIIELSLTQKENKIKRKTDSFYNSVCYYESQSIRAHLIVYGLLCGKSYKIIENKNKIEYDTNNENLSWVYLIFGIMEISKRFSTNEEQWSEELIKTILSRSEHKEV